MLEMLLLLQECEVWAHITRLSPNAPQGHLGVHCARLLFDAIDDDHDGLVNRSDFKKWHDMTHGAITPVASVGIDLTGDGLANCVVNGIDGNSNGILDQLQVNNLIACLAVQNYAMI